MTKKYIKEIDPATIFADKDRNFRHSWKYKVQPLEKFDANNDVPGFFEDIVLNGVQTNIVIVKLTNDQIDKIERVHGIRPLYRVVRGHRRLTAVMLARSQNAGLFVKLTCEIHEGLSEADEVAMMFDDKGVEHLDEFEIYKAIIRLYGTGRSHEMIGTLIGQERNYTQRRVYMWELPQVIKDEYEKRFTPVTGADGVVRNPKKGEDYIYFPWGEVDKLHVLRNQDVNGGVDPDAPESKTMEYWMTLVGKVKPAPGSSNVTALSKKKMDERKGFIRGCEALETAHAFYSGEGGNLAEAAEQYKALESQASLVPALKSRVADLETQVSELTILLDQKEAEILELAAGGVPTPVHVNGHGSLDDVLVENVA